jgi:hypothetical protein
MIYCFLLDKGRYTMYIEKEIAFSHKKTYRLYLIELIRKQNNVFVIFAHPQRVAIIKQIFL